MKQAICGALIVLFLVVMAALRWGPALTSHGLRDGYRLDRKGPMASVRRNGDIFADVKNIAVDNAYGKVRVEVTDGTPGWSWELTCWANTLRKAEYFAREIEMRVDQRPDRSSWTLVIPGRQPRQLRGLESNLTLIVPASVKVNVRNQHGDTEILGVQGETRARCQYSRIRLSDLAGNVDVETSHATITAERIPGARLVNRHGSITATGVEGDLQAITEHGQVVVHRVAGELRVNSQHGKVVASEIAGNAEIQTSYAEIQLEDADGDTVLRNLHGRISGRRLRGNVDALNQYEGIDLDVDGPEVVCKNRNGGIKLHLASPNLRSVRAETSHADLEVNVSESLSPKIQAQTNHGTVKSDFPVFAMGTGTNNFRDLDPGVPRLTLKDDYGRILINKAAKGNSSE